MRKLSSVFIAMSLMLIAMIASTCFASATSPIKEDYPIENSFFEDTSSSTVEIAHRLYIVNGDGDRHFRPSSPVTHAEFAQMCCNAFSPEPANLDHNATPWYRPAYEWLYLQTIATVAPNIDNVAMARLFEVYSDGRSAENFFRDDTYASYEHMVTMLYILRMTNTGSCIQGDVVKFAHNWATTSGIGYGPSNITWRYTQPTTDDTITREDAVRLLLGLTGLGHASDLPFGPEINLQ